MEKSIFIHADITRRVGTGHFWRDARLADKLAHSGAAVTLAIPDNETARAAAAKFAAGGQGRAVNFVFLPQFADNPLHLHQFAALPPAIVNAFPAGHDLYVFDNYRLGRDSLQAMGALGFKRALIDDFNHRNLTAQDAQIVINPISAHKISYGEANVLRPPQYHMLPPAFFEPRTRDPNHVFIAFSGIDHGQAGISFLKALNKADPDMGGKNLRFTLWLSKIADQFKPAADHLCETAGGRIQIISGFDPHKMMGESGMFVTAGGQASFEAQAARLPIAGIAGLNESSLPRAQELAEQGIVYANLDGILEGRDKSKQMAAFARAVAPVLSRRNIPSLPTVDPRGFDRLVNFLMQI